MRSLANGDATPHFIIPVWSRKYINSPPHSDLEVFLEYIHSHLPISSTGSIKRQTINHRTIFARDPKDRQHHVFDNWVSWRPRDGNLSHHHSLDWVCCGCPELIRWCCSRTVPRILPPDWFYSLRLGPYIRRSFKVLDQYVEIFLSLWENESYGFKADQCAIL